ncbi:MAG: hypothetical protein ACOC22_03475 [bacterium]
MTEEQFLNNFNALLPALEKMLINKAKKVIKSGAINLQQYEDNYQLPKIVLSAIAKDVPNQYSPINNQDRQEIEKICKFI